MKSISQDNCERLRFGGAAELPRSTARRALLGPAVTAALLAAPAAGQTLRPEQSLTSDQAAGMSLEELMALQVTSVAGTHQEWFSTPAAITVITGDDVRRGGFRTLADALRLAPGVFVGKSSSHATSVGMRGFNGSLANKTLVLIDGRTVYDPLFGGTFWDVQDVLLEDLDRIEVIRGPGATLWGANAVNGVINVTTKSARDTQGVFASGGGGTYERAFGEARYGFAVGDSSWLRVYGKWFERDHLVDGMGDSTHDDWSMWRGGFRFDHEGTDDLTLTFQGDAYYTDRIGEFLPNAPVPGQSIQFVNDIRDGRRRGANLLARLGKEHGDSGWSLQTYYDLTNRTTLAGFEVERHTLDVDWRHHFMLGDRHEIVWGLGARHTSDETSAGFNLFFNPVDDDFNTFSAFVQDTITLVPDRLFAMIGSKFSYNDYTGAEVQPSGRLWWTPDDRSTLWASISRPVRVPSRTEEQGTIVFGYIDSGILAGGSPTGNVIALGVQPNDDLNAERLLAYEAGYRLQVTDHLSLDAAAFYNDYDRLIYVPSVIEPWNNEGYGETYGAEIAITFRPTEQWRLRAAYSYADVQIHGSAVPADEGNTPHHQAQVQSYLDITDALELNAGAYYVDEVPQADASSYVRLDVGLTWRPSPNVELSVWGQNLLESEHREFSTNEVERGAYLMCTVRF